MLFPLREKQAQAAAAEAQRQADARAAELAAEQAVEARTSARVQSTGTYGNSYSFGNCTAYVASRVAVPNNWGNANNWLWSAQAAGWATGSVPRVGAIATTTAGWAGHVALVEAVIGNQVEVSEMNYNGFDVVDRRLAMASDFSYIY